MEIMFWLQVRCTVLGYTISCVVYGMYCMWSTVWCVLYGTVLYCTVLYGAIARHILFVND